ncbi:MAG: cbb3-type cytochrome c oxidase subunit 3 [Pseudomonas sp.]
MQIMLFIGGWVVMCIGMHFCVTRQSEHDLEQASLLPFADDPEAARAMSRATGKVCDKVVNVPFETAVNQATVDYIEA